jgi:glycosyltransferase involved in cell wall biosynthesis
MRIAMLLHKSVEHDSRVRREASALAAAGHEVYVLELASVGVGCELLDGFHRVSVMPSAWVRRRLPLALYRLAFLIYFVRGICRLRPGVVHAHDAAMLLPGLFGARLVRARLIYDSHELATAVPYRDLAWAWFVGAIERVAVRRSAAVITVSEGIATCLQNLYRLPVAPTVLRNVSALELDGAGGLRHALGLAPDTPLVLHQGAPAPARGCEVLVESVAALDDVHLVFLGDPEPGYGDRLRATIDKCGVADRVSLLPSVPLDALLAYTSEADVGVTLLQDTCENHRLALPNKLFEYIAAGVPVVASALPETQRLVQSYDVGWCAAPDDQEAVTAALRRALDERRDPARRQRLAIAARELRWDREQLRLVELYRRLEAAPWPRNIPLGLLLVRNTVSNDSRVLRSARVVARAIDGEALVIGVAGDDAPAGDAVVGGVRITRLAPIARTLPRLSPNRSSGPTSAARPAGSPPHETLPPRARLRRVAVGGWFLARAVAIARRLRPRVVHANDWNTMWAGLLVKLLCGSRLIYDSHELWADRNGRWENRAWLIVSEALFVRVADEVLTTSVGHARALATRYRIPEPTVVRNIPDWVAGVESVLSEPPLIIYLGGLMPGRGLEQMIDALPDVPGISFRAIGPGAAHYRASLEQRARSCGVADRFELRPAVQPDAVSAALRGAAIGLCLIQPACRSYELSLPNKLLEYAAAGLPVLASDLPVIGAVVRGYGLGVTVPPAEARMIAVGVRRLLDPGVRSQAIAGARRFTAENTWAIESELLVRAYRAR